MQKIKWVLFHTPEELFIRTAKHFEAEVNKLSNNKFEFDILTLDDYQNKYNEGRPCDLFADLRNGKIHMSQMYIFSLAFSNATDFLALGLPFLFKDHDHASRVFESKVGEDLLTHLKDTLQIKGLSFTYSGGYKVMASDSPINCVDDFQKLTYAKSGNGLWTDMFQALGAKESSDFKKANFRQTTLPRYHADAANHQRFCTDTQHSMYLTTILMNDNLWTNFDSDTKEIFKYAAKVTAKAERVQSVADGEKIASSPAIYNQHGIDQMLYFSDEEQNRLKETLSPLINKWKPYFSQGLVDRIQAA